MGKYGGTECQVGQTASAQASARGPVWLEGSTPLGKWTRIPQLLCGEPGYGGRSGSRERGEVGTGLGRVVAAEGQWKDVLWPGGWQFGTPGPG